MKATLEEVQSIDDFAALIDGAPAREIESFRTDPLSDRYEVNFRIPENVTAGGHVLELKLGNRSLTVMGIEVIR